MSVLNESDLMYDQPIFKPMNRRNRVVVRKQKCWKNSRPFQHHQHFNFNVSPYQLNRIGGNYYE